MNQEPMFQVGDKVKAFGVEGVVIEIRNNSYFPIVVDFNGNIRSFLPDGRNEEFHKEPSLHLVERPKKKMRIEAWANVYSDNAFVVHDTHDLPLLPLERFVIWLKEKSIP